MRFSKLKFKLYKRYRADFWGKLSTDPLTNLRILKFFKSAESDSRKEYLSKLFLADISLRKKAIPPLRLKGYTRRLVNELKLKWFYYNIKRKKLRKLLRVSLQKTRKTSMFRLLELRLDVVIYRSNFLSNFRNIRQFILYKNVLVNFIIVNSLNYFLKVGDYVSFTLKGKEIIKMFLLRKLNFNYILSIYLKSKKVRAYLKKKQSKVLFYKRFKYFKRIKELRINYKNLLFLTKTISYKFLNRLPVHLLVNYRLISVLIISQPKDYEIYYPSGIESQYVLNFFKESI